MLELAHGLDDRALAAIADLERRVVAADGGRLKLEWSSLRSRSGQHVEDLLWWNGDRLDGFLGIYAFGFPVAELAGMVDPEARRRGIATALLDGAGPLCAGRGFTRTLLVTPRSPAAGRDLALRRGAVFDHSEYALQLTAVPPEKAPDPRITVRPAAPSDIGALATLLTLGFGWAPAAPQEPELHETLIVERDGAIAGSLRLTRDDDTAGIYGFVVHPDLQGQGIGREVLRRVSAQALRDGAARVQLEVLVDNDRALGLYTSTGFVPVATEDYYALTDESLAGS